jgi:hypothetical protein
MKMHENNFNIDNTTIKKGCKCLSKTKEEVIKCSKQFLDYLFIDKYQQIKSQVVK